MPPQLTFFCSAGEPSQHPLAAPAQRVSVQHGGLPALANEQDRERAPKKVGTAMTQVTVIPTIATNSFGIFALRVCAEV